MKKKWDKIERNDQRKRHSGEFIQWAKGYVGKRSVNNFGRKNTRRKPDGSKEFWRKRKK